MHFIWSWPGNGVIDNIKAFKKRIITNKKKIQAFKNRIRQAGASCAYSLGNGPSLLKHTSTKLRHVAQALSVWSVLAQPACVWRHLVWHFPASTHHELSASWLILTGKMTSVVSGCPRRPASVLACTWPIDLFLYNEPVKRCHFIVDFAGCRVCARKMYQLWILALQWWNHIVFH